MFFNSLSFLVFFPLVVLATFAVPKRLAHLTLLAASYYFYMCWNARYAVLIAVSTLATYVCALAVERVPGKGLRRAAMLACLLLNLGILAFFKYWGFLGEMLARVLGLLGVRVSIPRFDVLLPVGISFYTFQALGYMLDVYRGEIEAERSLTRYALFVSFFPQLVAGPIERSKNLLRQVNEIHSFDFDRARQGLLVMLLGFFEKLIVADRASLYVDAVFSRWQSAAGWQLMLATVVFAFQIYGDFSGYSHIAIGAAKVLGFDLMDNFRQPYFATSVRDFWRRWHISLSTWFRDYVYIPLGGSRAGAWRRAINTMITFTVSGLWHGAALTYVFWGALNGALQVLEGALHRRGNGRKASGGTRRAVGTLPAGRMSPLRVRDVIARLGKMLMTFAVIDVTWLFFRASALGTAFRMLQRMALSFAAPAVKTGFSAYQAGALGLGIAILLAMDALHESGRSLSAMTERLPRAVAGALSLAAVLAIVVFGVWGADYSAQAFIYFQF